MFLNELQQSISQGKQVDATILDFSKAFDVVPHHKLLYKLQYYGIGGTTLRWIASFLSERSQRVVVDNEFSDEAPVTSGVPQGSVLGPILFLVFINDMPKVVKSNCRLFADDSIVYREISTDRDRDILQADLDRLHQWELDWGMSFNPSKCNTMHITRKSQPTPNNYSLKGQTLENVQSAPYLGVTISENISWDNQIQKITAKANRTLGFVKCNLKEASRPARSLAYQMLVRPQLEYCCTVWSPYQLYQIHKMEMVQRRAASVCDATLWPTECHCHA